MRLLDTAACAVPVRVGLIPPGSPNRPGLPLTPRWLTVHETANPAPGANAEAHRRFAASGGGPEHVSFHFVVDDHEAIQLLPLDEVAWHAGDGPDGPGNRTAIAIETCVNADGDWARTLANLVALLAALGRQLGLGTAQIVQHHHWSGKDCPHRIRAEGRWEQLLADVAAQLSGPVQPGTTPGGDTSAAGAVRRFPETGYGIGGGFRAFWERLERAGLALLVLGYPQSNEFRAVLDGRERVVQVFERGVLVWEPEHAPPWDVHLALLDQVRAVLAALNQTGG